MVRLEYAKYPIANYLQFAFQFLNGTIGVTCCFGRQGCESSFQFLNGTIGVQQVKGTGYLQGEFQFLNGTIGVVLVFTVLFTPSDFNS